jgi:3',5'-nucleoside bisphosphate phosphatase
VIEADLHIHTTASDGEHSPEEIVSLAGRLKLKVLAVTDHDSVDHVDRGMAAAEGTDLRVIPGVEISCVYQGEEIHILGYFIDSKNKGLLELLQVLKHSRHERLEKMLGKAEKLGFSLKPQDIEYHGAPGRAHVGRALVRRGYVRDLTEAFERYLGLGGPLYVDRYEISPAEILAALKEAGGVTSLAHPGLVQERRLVGEMISAGVEALEVYYPLHTRRQVKEFRALAQAHGLAVTGGSDFHGPGSPNRLGAAGISLAEVAGLEKRRKI